MLKLLLDSEKDEALARIFQPNRITGGVVGERGRVIENVKNARAQRQPAPPIPARSRARSLHDCLFFVRHARDRFGPGAFRKAPAKHEIEGGGIIDRAVPDRVLIGVGVIERRDGFEATDLPAELRATTELRAQISPSELAHRLRRARLLLKAVDDRGIEPESELSSGRHWRNVFQRGIEALDFHEAEVLELRVDEKQVARDAKRLIARRSRSAHYQPREIVLVLDNELRVETRDRVLDLDPKIIRRERQP